MTRLLAVDIGNSTVSVGLFEDDRLKKRIDLPALPILSEEQIAAHLAKELGALGLALSNVEGVALSSVIPEAGDRWQSFVGRYLQLTPLVVTGRTPTPLRLRYEDPDDLGPDRLVNAVAAFDRVGGPVIIASVGTATVVDAVSEKGEYLGGTIQPGPGLALEALAAGAARLPRLELEPPPRLIGANTRESMLAGVVFGTVGAVEMIAELMATQFGADCPLVVTGGWASLLLPYLETKYEHLPDLTLTGLQLVWAFSQAPTPASATPKRPRPSRRAGDAR